MSKEYIVISPFIARTPSGDVRVQAGATIQMPEKTAVRLIEMGKIKAFAREPEGIKPIKNRTIESVPMCVKCGAPNAVPAYGIVAGEPRRDYFCLSCMAYKIEPD